MCAFCGADTADAIETSVFSRNIRVLTCVSCDAPLPVPIGGGKGECAWCHVPFDVMARREHPLGSGKQQDDPKRLERLRDMDDGPEYLPPDIRRLYSGGGDHGKNHFKSHRISTIPVRVIHIQKELS
ncbi:MAG: hypothetical protein JXX14_19795 [Deltaproteobacteria bacterium]|nr:hypothetical protein [Deltaproteobacteria bacterium]